MKVLLVTTWNTPCGIAEHSRMLKEAVEHADPTIQVDPRSEALDPTQLLRPDMGLVHLNMHDKPAELLIHLNHHDGLHSRWTPESRLRNPNGTSACRPFPGRRPSRHPNRRGDVTPCRRPR